MFTVHWRILLKELRAGTGCCWEWPAVTRTAKTTQTDRWQVYALQSALNHKPGIRFMWKYSGTEYWAENKPNNIPDTGYPTNPDPDLQNPTKSLQRCLSHQRCHHSNYLKSNQRCCIFLDDQSRNLSPKIVTNFVTHTQTDGTMQVLIRILLNF